jgi:pimeloyl-ACP methyl ester carboxylesterase
MKRLVLWFCVAALQSSCFLSWGYQTKWPEPVETHRVRTSDGWELDLRHVKPVGAQTHPRPVILQHGMVTNGRNMDFDEKHSLARALAKEGFDVWVTSLRGTGDSEKRSLFSVADEETSFDAFVTRDMPAIISYVKEKTGVAKVDYVGHSMGGMILYAYLSRGGTDIERGVTMGSPVRLQWTGTMERLVRNRTRYAKLSKWFPLRSITRSASPLNGKLDGPIEHLLINPENIDPETWQGFLAVGTDDLPNALVAQFSGWLESGLFDSVDHSIDYLEGLRKVNVPIMVVAGKIDGIAPPWMVRPAYDALPSPEKRWLVLGEANGQHADYNHMCMVLGERAPTEFWPQIAAFLAR